MAAKKATKKATEPFQCLPLEDNLQPKWKSPEAFEKWHSDIWTWPVNPKNFGAPVFTPNCLMEGPIKAATLRGAAAAAYVFRRLFKRYPDLSGKHISWAYNKTQVFFNWCFVTTKGLVELKVPAMDVFCVEKGLVQYRLTAFNLESLQTALDRAYPPPPEAPPQEQVGIDYLWPRWHLEGAAEAALSLRKAR